MEFYVGGVDAQAYPFSAQHYDLASVYFHRYDDNGSDELFEVASGANCEGILNFACFGTVTFLDVSGSTISGMLVAAFPYGMLNGTFSAAICPGAGSGD